FHTLKVELVHQRWWATRDEARRDLFAYIEGYYNTVRPHGSLSCRPPAPEVFMPARRSVVELFSSQF
ncbi:integrase core domain-containing protein, partial [Methylobacterium nigriterrae]|uniref:integrase core domain-containing protein n=1 Tax=Methylobacterium nigriterrae TaxID=3127512 RepID=UPI003013280D